MIGFPGVEKIWTALPEARVVGGAVRDSLAGRPVADVDFASPLSPSAVMARLNAAGIRTVPTGIAHGTITAIAAGRGFEITTLRRDIATDGRRAVVAYTDDWQADAARRDFTINAMSMARDGALFDYFGGAEDLRNGAVRFVGDAATRITEDYLRILRFFRFFARYARGDPDAEAVAAITALRDGLAHLSAERIWSELKNLLAAPDPAAAAMLMQSTGVLARVIPEGAAVEKLRGLIARAAPVEPLLRVAALLEGDAGSFAARLKLSTAETETLQQFRQPGTLTPFSDDAALRRALADADAETLIAQSWLAQDNTPGWEALRARLAAMPRPVFPLHGRDITALGIPPGPRVGEILHEVRAWWLAGGCMADAAACRAEARRAAI
jgi:poly(A) polymerase/tRNA nucleotidyltransferase (CCA-adding enzyme)